MKDFYPDTEPYDHCLLNVGDGHQLYVEQCGNPQGQPVLFIHGGPGGGCSTNDRRFFDPEQYRIILFDQRGCGRSIPHGSLENNDSPHLTQDINTIRDYLHIDQWHIFGGSWGSTLALLYAQAYPQNVNSLVLRGIFLARQEDCDWTFNAGGAHRIFPDYFADFLQALPCTINDDMTQAAYNVMTGDDYNAALKVARAWSLWEIRCCTLMPNAEFVADKTDDKSCWTLARHEAHFMVNQCFLTDNQILNNCDKIAHIPTIIVHGRYDVVCPIDQAWLLHQRLPLAELWVSNTAGHTSAEPETKDKLIEATQRMLQK